MKKYLLLLLAVSLNCGLFAFFKGTPKNPADWVEVPIGQDFYVNDDDNYYIRGIGDWTTHGTPEIRVNRYPIQNRPNEARTVVWIKLKKKLVKTPQNPWDNALQFAISLGGYTFGRIRVRFDNTNGKICYEAFAEVHDKYGNASAKGCLTEIPSNRPASY
ncbi:MAG: hypothetical protein LBL61_07115 [Elusimicrobiota bacterium]|jgi:hypothetical protein|nr:hypothetical protein [Elusimicrobiota bacterium]